RRRCSHRRLRSRPLLRTRAHRAQSRARHHRRSPTQPPTPHSGRFPHSLPLNFPPPNSLASHSPLHQFENVFVCRLSPLITSIEYGGGGATFFPLTILGGAGGLTPPNSTACSTGSGFVTFVSIVFLSAS